jgi:hypothetical protein
MRSIRDTLCKWTLASIIAVVTIEAMSSGQVRPPAVPLVVHNPYFSIWSMADKLTDQNTKHWTGVEQPLTGMLRVDGSVYRYKGEGPSPDVPPMKQLSLRVEATRTIYVFEAAGVQLELTFFTPAFPEDLDILSRPVTYLAWHIHSIDGKKHEVSVLLDIDPRIAVDREFEPVVWGRFRAGALTVLSVGSQSSKCSRAQEMTSVSIGAISMWQSRIPSTQFWRMRPARWRVSCVPAHCPRPTISICPQGQATRPT